VYSVTGPVSRSWSYDIELGNFQLNANVTIPCLFSMQPSVSVSATVHSISIPFTDERSNLSLRLWLRIRQFRLGSSLRV
jgi:hypothetical protein